MLYRSEQQCVIHNISSR